MICYMDYVSWGDKARWDYKQEINMYEYRPLFNRVLHNMFIRDLSRGEISLTLLQR